MTSLTGRDLRDMAMALMVEPLAGQPDKLAEFVDDVLYAPLPGSAEAKRKAKADALKEAGIPNMAAVRRMLEERQAAAEAAAAQGESNGTPSP